MTRASASAPIRFGVFGTPRPQGSKTLGRKRGSGRPVILEGRNASQRARFHEWRNTVAGVANTALLQAGRTTPLVGPIEVDVTFVHSRPGSTPKGYRWRTKMPDLDKEIRAVLDALKAAGLIGDDALVAQLNTRKVLAEPDEHEGAVITVTPLDHADGPHSVSDWLPATPTPSDLVRGSHRPQRTSTSG